MKVIALQNVRLLGTELTLTEGKTYNAEPVTNQPSGDTDKQVFVSPDQDCDDSILCTLGDEVQTLGSVLK